MLICECAKYTVWIFEAQTVKVHGQWLVNCVRKLLHSPNARKLKTNMANSSFILIRASQLQNHQPMCNDTKLLASTLKIQTKHSDENKEEIFKQVCVLRLQYCVVLICGQCFLYLEYLCLSHFIFCCSISVLK